jgi:drug/metabolite transporter (DMT)-like permease
VPGRAQLVSTGVILAGGLLVGWQGITAGGADVATGIGFFLAGSVVLSMYMVAIRVWQISPYQALAMVNIPNAAVFLPLWFFALPSGMAETETHVLIAHALFQGVGPGFCALMLFTAANYHLGAGPTAAISAAVPALAALLAIPVLGEVPSPLEWVGIAIVCTGLGLLIRAR